MNKQRFIQLIQTFNFKELFNELGWDNSNIEINFAINSENFKLKSVAEKRGFIIFVCSPNSQGSIPPKDIRKKLDNQLSKLYYEHLIIFTDENNNRQLWQLVIREPNKPLIIRETDYFRTQHPENLFQKLRGLFISLDQEENITLADIRSNVVEQFNQNAERVTRRFYDEFKKHHSAFLKFINGIQDTVTREWYASLMLNRLMFIYFIQKKGFLDNNPNYLHDKLRETQRKKGKDKFYSFYRNFLLILFHKGLGTPESERTEEIIKELGKVPYLNGGLFDIHEIEQQNPNIEIPDIAFENIFNFFDQYNWHLDTRITASGRDINPDVIGYIFEKYINDRAQLGAYYTKEDITEYIAKNTIIPFLFDKVKNEVANAFREDSSIWKLLKENPDRYIYDAVKYGVSLSDEEFNSTLSLDDPDHPLWRDLPDEIKVGFRPDLKDKIVVADERPHLWEIRKPWNNAAPSDIALPTEIYRELIERRKRYFEIRKKLKNGEIQDINDFITYNLNIRQFAQDVIEQYEGSDLINAFYKAITKITILDPACGSGAFLFAALNILEPLYYACIQRMKGFVESDTTGKKYSNFRKILDDIKKHPNEQYYIYKSIILNNLYGVDIMKEAVETAKLRLFLKLVAEVDEIEQIEPLPDIDFNIKSGNSLVGFVHLNEIKEVYEEKDSEGRLLFEEVKNFTKSIIDKADTVSKLFTEFKYKQNILEQSHSELRETKELVRKKLNELNELLNEYKAYEYGIDASNVINQKKYNDWLKSHKPFHWFSEYYEIIEENGGFDVIIGNPPYVEYSKIKEQYQIKNYKSIDCDNTSGFFLERCNDLLKYNSFISMILPISLATTERMLILQSILLGSKWFSFYSERPSKLFNDAEQETCILIFQKKLYSIITMVTKYFKWYSEQRTFRNSSIFDLISYNIHIFYFGKLIHRLGSQVEYSIFDKLKKLEFIPEDYLGTNDEIYIHKRGRYWLKAIDNEIKLSDFEFSSIWNKILVYKELKDYLICLFNSTLFYLISKIAFNTRILTQYDFKNFKIFRLINENENRFKDLKVNLISSYFDNAKVKLIKYKSGIQRQYVFYPNKSKLIIDEIDTVLGENYKFSEEELDYIINYDIKYRMGKDNNEDE